ncbi:helix-turn-helix transcriptional regulator [Scytonema sp. PRP1]|uniref:helix-turn-helix transcriptional regulator n=1 Tax=Scytonema sp. PRP1 TaxID=3120513 RepID=UPI003FA728B9
MRVKEDLLYKKIGERIRDRRTKAKLTQGQLADAIGVLRTSITNIEAGDRKLLFTSYTSFVLF